MLLCSSLRFLHALRFATSSNSSPRGNRETFYITEETKSSVKSLLSASSSSTIPSLSSFVSLCVFVVADAPSAEQNRWAVSAHSELNRHTLCDANERYEKKTSQKKKDKERQVCSSHLPYPMQTSIRQYKKKHLISSLGSFSLNFSYLTRSGAVPCKLTGRASLKRRCLLWNGQQKNKRAKKKHV
jgi:hypothetical protein